MEEYNTPFGAGAKFYMTSVTSRGQSKGRSYVDQYALNRLSCKSSWVIPKSSYFTLIMPDEIHPQPESFEIALAELEATVARMEGGQLSLQESLAAYKRGAELLRYCQAALQDAEQQVKILEGEVLQNFGGADSAS